MARRFTPTEIRGMMYDQGEAILDLPLPASWLPDLPEAERVEAWKLAMNAAAGLVMRDGTALDRLIR
jgi:hypothetical protein